MGYLIKSNVIDALEEDMHSTMMCYEGKKEKDIVEFCYECMRRAIEELPQYQPDNVYEDTGLTPDQIRKLKDRDTAKAPIKPKTALDAYYHEPSCPNCGREFTPKICGYKMPQAIGYFDFCPACGQRLKWED